MSTPPFELLDALSPRRRQLKKLRAKWGQPGAKDGWLASHYFELTRDRSAAKCVNDKTWSDLEFPRHFLAARFDRDADRRTSAVQAVARIRRDAG